jgi:hypothetical protein
MIVFPGVFPDSFSLDLSRNYVNCPLNSKLSLELLELLELSKLSPELGTHFICPSALAALSM